MFVKQVAANGLDHRLIYESAIKHGTEFDYHARQFRPQDTQNLPASEYYIDDDDHHKSRAIRGLDPFLKKRGTATDLSV